jgi:hypothetical protein
MKHPDLEKENELLLTVLLFTGNSLVSQFKLPGWCQQESGHAQWPDAPHGGLFARP